MKARSSPGRGHSPPGLTHPRPGEREAPGLLGAEEGPAEPGLEGVEGEPRPAREVPPRLLVPQGLGAGLLGESGPLRGADAQLAVVS